jgi:hypothetical protein
MEEIERVATPRMLEALEKVKRENPDLFDKSKSKP